MPSMSVACVDASHRRTDAGGIGYLARVRYGALLRRRSWRARNITRSDRTRESKFVRARFILQQLNDGKGDMNFAAWGNIRHRLSKDIGALLVQQRRGMACVACRIVDLARFLALFDYRLDLSLAHLHGHPVHGAVMGQGEYIDGFHGVRQDVFILLRHFNAGNKAADFCLYGGMLERDKPGHLSVFADDFHLAAARCGRSSGGALRLENDEDIKRKQGRHGGQGQTDFHGVALLLVDGGTLEPGVLAGILWARDVVESGLCGGRVEELIQTRALALAPLGLKPVSRTYFFTALKGRSSTA